MTRFRFDHFLIAVSIFIAEILVATTFSKIYFIRSFLSDYLVVILIYHLVKSIRHIDPLPLSIGVFIFACIDETAQYFHLADVLGLRAGSLPRIILGTCFSWVDILMYLLGCITAYFADSILMTQAKQRSA